MTAAERETVATLIADNTARVEAYDALQEKIENAQKFAGNVYQVGAVTQAGDTLKISNPDIIAAMETEIAEYITAKQAEQAAL
jgi:hypothetical protein